VEVNSPTGRRLQRCLSLSLQAAEPEPMPLWVWCTPGTVGQIVTGFSRIVPLAALCGLPNAYPSPGGSLTRLRATLGRPLGSPSHAECRSLTGVSPSHRRAPGHHATARALAQQHVPGNANGCHLACIQGVPGGSSGAPALSRGAIYMSSGCYLCRCRR